MRDKVVYKSGEICERCGILFKKRFEEWSLCTVHSPPALVAQGHMWNRNPYYEKDLASNPK